MRLSSTGTATNPRRSERRRRRRWPAPSRLAGIQPHSPAERERLNYLTRHVEFLVPYAESWSVAYHLNQMLTAAELKKHEGKNEEAREKVRAEGVPLWLKLAPLVREAILASRKSSARATIWARLLPCTTNMSGWPFPPARFHEGIPGRIAAGSGEALRRGPAP